MREVVEVLTLAGVWHEVDPDRATAGAAL
jgi:hypothetical protein